MIFVDSDIFVIDLRYQRDEKYEDNKQFIKYTDQLNQLNLLSRKI